MPNGYLWYFIITSLVNAVTAGVLACFVLFTGYQKRVARYLFYFCFSIVCWSLPYFLWQISDTQQSAYLWSRILMFGAIFTSISSLHLVIVFLNKDRDVFYKIILGIFYFFCFLWVGINTFTQLFVSGVAERLFFPFWPTPGPFYLPFLIGFSFHVLYASYLLWKERTQVSGDKKTQLSIMLFANAIAFIGGATNFPLWFNIPIAPWGNVTVTLYVVLTVYSIMRYKFLDLRVVTAELFTGIILVVFLVDVFLSKSTPELVFRLIALTVMILFSFILVKAVRTEVERREEITQLARSLEQANIRLQELDRQKTEFLSIASHQLRTPLSILKGYIELIGDGAYGKPTKKMLAVLSDMNESNERLVTLVDDFLDITRIEQGRTTYTFDMHSMVDLIQSVVKELSDRAETQGLRIAWKPNVSMKDVYMDQEKIRHVVFNFVDNAIKYSKEGTITILFSEEDNGFVVRVRDKGFGFDKEDEVNFFQKFYRGKNVQGTNVNGTGLGIYVCKKFIEHHHGKVWATSPGLGKGSEFGFWLPGGEKEKTEVTDSDIV